MTSKTLLEEVSSIEALNIAWSKLNKNNEFSYGISGENIKRFKDNKEEKLTTISQQLLTHKYRFRPYRPVAIPKDNKKFRPLQIPEISDRVVLKSIAITIEKYLNTVLEKGNGVSFAYQKDLGIKDAINKIKEHKQNGYTHIFETDIIDFFPTVNLDKLLDEQVYPHLPDRTLNKLIASALKQKVKGVEKLPQEHQALFKNSGEGIPQGNALSPLLSNIYLSPFDEFMKLNNFRLVRYADDFVVLFKTSQEATACYEMCKKFLEQKLGLKIHDLKSDKTNIIDSRTSNFSFLSIVFDNDKIYPSQKNIENFKNRLKKKFYSEDTNLLEILYKTQNALDGWVSAFFFTNIEQCTVDIDTFINRQLFLYINKIDWKIKGTSKMPVKYRKKGESSNCLSKEQRKNSGISFCLDLAKEKRVSAQQKENDIINPHGKQELEDPYKAKAQ